MGALKTGALSSLGGALLGGGVGAGQQWLGGGDPVMGAELGAASGALGGPLGMLGERLTTRAIPRSISPFFRNEEGPRATRKRAVGILGDLMKDDQLTSSGLLGKLDPKLPLTLTDVGLENIRARSAEAGRTPGPARNDARRLADLRKKLYPDLVMDAVKQHLTPSYDLNTTGAQLKKTKEDAAKTLYDAALYDKDPTTGELKPKVVSDPKLDPLLDRLHAVGAFKKAEQLAKAYGEPAPMPLVEPDPVAGTPGKYYLTARQADLVKQGLDGLIGKTYGSAEPDRNLGRAYTQLKHEYVGELDNLLPLYHGARMVFTNHSKSQEALEAGRKFDSGNMDDQLDYFSSLDPGDQDFFRVGMGQRMHDAVGKTTEGQVPLRSFFKTNDQKNQTALFFRDPAEYDAFSGKFGRVMDMAATDNSLNANSLTQQRLQEQAAAEHADLADNPLLNIARHPGGIPSGILNEGLKMTAADQDAVHKLTAAELTKILRNPQYHDNVKLLGDVDKKLRGDRVRSILNDVSKWTGAGVGAAGTSAVTTQKLPGPEDQPDPLAGGYAEGGRVRDNLWTHLKFAEGGQVNPLKGELETLLDPAHAADMEARRHADFPADPEGYRAEVAQAVNAMPDQARLPAGETPPPTREARLGEALEQARQTHAEQQAADEEYQREVETGGEEYAKRRHAPLVEGAGDWSGTHGYLTPEGTTVDFGPGDEAIPGSDELYSALRATLGHGTGEGWGGRYDNWLAGRRNAGDRFLQDHPVQGYGAMLASPAAGLGVLSKAAKVLPKLARAPAAAAGLGGLYGFAGGEGGVKNRLKSAGLGALAGSALSSPAVAGDLVRLLRR